MTCRLIIFLFFSLLSAQVFSQASIDSTFKSNEPASITINPGFNYHLQFSHLDLNPTLSCHLKPWLQPGLGLNYLYHYRHSERKGTSTLGFNVFTNLYINKFIYAHAEYLFSNVAYLNKLDYKFTRVNIVNYFVGVGYRQNISNNDYAYLSLLFDLTHTDNSPYKNKFLLKIGFTF
ncbi:MAG TPA: hypothetical protein VF691_07665 [Cytophagaceae bacterium]|jgi:hypothetical protein